jgi:hypothetical protein
MFGLYTRLEQSSVGMRLALVATCLRVIGAIGFFVLGMYLISEGDYLDAVLSALMVSAWLAATMEARDWVLERFP